MVAFGNPAEDEPVAGAVRGECSDGASSFGVVAARRFDTRRRETRCTPITSVPGNAWVCPVAASASPVFLEAEFDKRLRLELELVRFGGLGRRM